MGANSEVDNLPSTAMSDEHLKATSGALPSAPAAHSAQSGRSRGRRTFFRVAVTQSAIPVPPTVAPKPPSARPPQARPHPAARRGPQLRNSITGIASDVDLAVLQDANSAEMHPGENASESDSTDSSDSSSDESESQEEKKAEEERRMLQEQMVWMKKESEVRRRFSSPTGKPLIASPPKSPPRLQLPSSSAPSADGEDYEEPPSPFSHKEVVQFEEALASVKDEGSCQGEREAERGKMLSTVMHKQRQAAQHLKELLPVSPAPTESTAVAPSPSPHDEGLAFSSVGSNGSARSGSGRAAACDGGKLFGKEAERERRKESIARLLRDEKRVREIVERHVTRSHESSRRNSAESTDSAPLQPAAVDPDSAPGSGMLPGVASHEAPKSSSHEDTPRSRGSHEASRQSTVTPELYIDPRDVEEGDVRVGDVRLNGSAESRAVDMDRERLDGATVRPGAGGMLEVGVAVEGGQGRQKSAAYQGLLAKADTRRGRGGEEDSEEEEERRGGGETLGEVLRRSGLLDSERCILDALSAGRSVERVTQRLGGSGRSVGSVESTSSAGGGSYLLTGRLWKRKAAGWSGKPRWKPRLFVLDVGGDRLMYCRERGGRHRKKLLGFIPVSLGKAGGAGRGEWPEEGGEAASVWNAEPVTLRSHFVLKVEEDPAAFSTEECRPVLGAGWALTYVQEAPSGNHLDAETGRPLGRRRTLQVCCGSPGEKELWLSALNRWLAVVRGTAKMMDEAGLAPAADDERRSMLSHRGSTGQALGYVE